MLIKNKELNNMTNETKKMLTEISKQQAILESKLSELAEEKAEAKREFTLKHMKLLEQKLELYEAEQNLLKAEGVK
jgi:hypothetical protein